MKTAISLPDPLFEELDRAATRLRQPRSAVVARALRELFERMPPEEDVTATYDNALDNARASGWDEEADMAFLRRAAVGVERMLRRSE